MFKGNENELRQALEEAKKVKGNITHCEEWKSAFIFYNNAEAKRGESRAVAYMKDTHKIVCYGEFLAIAPEDDDVIRNVKV